MTISHARGASLFRRPPVLVVVRSLHLRRSGLKHAAVSSSERAESLCFQPPPPPSSCSAFHSRALSSIQAAAERLEELGVPVSRPPDYYAEMVRALIIAPPPLPLAFCFLPSQTYNPPHSSPSRTR